MRKAFKIRRRTSLAVLLAAAAAISVAACSSSGSGSAAASASASSGGPLVVDGVQIATAQQWAAAKAEGSFTIYTSLNQASIDKMQSYFQKLVPLKMNVVRLTSAALVTRAESENSAGKLGADIIQLADPSLVKEVSDAGLFAPYCFTGLNAIPAQFRAKDCSYWASEMLPLAVVYNKEAVSSADAPTSWQSVLNPVFKGKIAFQNIGAGGTSWALQSWLRQTYGLQYWQKLAAQQPQVDSDGAQPVTSVSQGQVLVALVDAADGINAVNSGSPLGIVFPQSGTTAFGLWGGLTKASKNAAAAKVYLQFLASKPGQQAVAQIDNDWPVIPGMPGPVLQGKALPSLIQMKAVDVETNQALQQQRSAYITQWNTMFHYSA